MFHTWDTKNKDLQKTYEPKTLSAPVLTKKRHSIAWNKVLYATEKIFRTKSVTTNVTNRIFIVFCDFNYLLKHLIWGMYCTLCRIQYQRILRMPFKIKKICQHLTLYNWRYFWMMKLKILQSKLLKGILRTSSNIFDGIFLWLLDFS